MLEVYVRPFPNVEEGRVLVSQGGGNGLVWGPDENELFYWASEGMMVVNVYTDPRFSVVSRELLFEDTGIYTYVPRTYDVAPDGDRFLMIKPESLNGDASQIVLVQNWAAELQRLVPTP